MPMENWKEYRLHGINMKLAALGDALFHVSNGLEHFIEEKGGNGDIDTVIYGQETIEGVFELIGDVKGDIMMLMEQIEEERTGHLGQGKEDLGIPDKI